MILLTPRQTATLQNRFLPEQPGPLIGSHIIQTGNGACFVDRWPDPRAILADAAGNYTLQGDPEALTPDDLRPHLKGVMACAEEFLPLLEAACGNVERWPRIIFEATDSPAHVQPGTHAVRSLGKDDAYHLWGMSTELAWISKTWGGPTGLAASGLAWGAFVEGRLASLACTFFLGVEYEDIGVVTEPDYRGMGLSTACAAALCRDIRARGRLSTWSTSLDNVASQRVAEKLGLVVVRHDWLYLVGISAPQPAE